MARGSLEVKLPIYGQMQQQRREELEEKTDRREEVTEEKESGERRSKRAKQLSLGALFEVEPLKQLHPSQKATCMGHSWTLRRRKIRPLAARSTC